MAEKVFNMVNILFFFYILVIELIFLFYVEGVWGIFVEYINGLEPPSMLFPICANGVVMYIIGFIIRSRSIRTINYEIV